MPLSQPGSDNPFGKDIVEWDVYLSQVTCLENSIGEYREEEPTTLPSDVRRMHMLFYLAEMEEHNLVEALNSMGLNGRIVWNNTKESFQSLHGKEDE
jgi:hypothetical protein